MNKQILLSSILALSFLLIFSIDSAYAHPHVGQIMINGHHTHKPQTEIIPLNEMIGIEKSSIFLHAADARDNLLLQTFVEGSIANPVGGHPVIIQIFKDNDSVHFAQTNVDQDGNYEFKFSVSNSDSGITSKIFDGDYSVKIFKVVYLDHESVI